jgi:hypothetical protein
MRREWEPEDLIASWTLIDPDWELIGSKPGATRLWFAALLKFFEIDGRFPEYAAEGHCCIDGKRAGLATMALPIRGAGTSSVKASRSRCCGSASRPSS